MRAGYGKPPAGWKRLTDEERARILELRAQSKTIREIEMLTGRSEATVKLVLRKARLVA